MTRRPARSKRTYTRFPYTTRCRSLDGRPRWNEAIVLAAFELEHGGCDAGMARDIDAIGDELMEVEQAVESIACCTARHIIASGIAAEANKEDRKSVG